jgi:hypothetical protein
MHACLCGACTAPVFWVGRISVEGMSSGINCGEQDGWFMPCRRTHPSQLPRTCLWVMPMRWQPGAQQQLQDPSPCPVLSSRVPATHWLALATCQVHSQQVSEGSGSSQLLDQVHMAHT